MRISDWSSDVCSSDLAQDDAVKSDGTPYTATDLREIQDWIIKPQLRNVSGVTEINSIGGYNKEYQVAPLPARLSSSEERRGGKECVSQGRSLGWPYP